MFFRTKTWGEVREDEGHLGSKWNRLAFVSENPPPTPTTTSSSAFASIIITTSTMVTNFKQRL